MGNQHKALVIAGLVDSSGGGSGGTTDYSDLSNKPQINSVTLDGNKSSADLGLVSAESGKGLSSNDFTTAEKTKLAGIEDGATMTWTGTEAQYAQQAASIPTGTPVIITDDEPTDYIIMGNGKRLYLTDTEPTGDDIPEGSVWLGGAVNS